jgi:Pathogenicity locus
MKKATHESRRDQIEHLESIVNVGRSIADDFRRIGIVRPQQLIKRDPWKLYVKLCQTDKVFHDPCWLDCAMAAICFMGGAVPQVWWDFTAERKTKYNQRVERLRKRFAKKST